MDMDVDHLPPKLFSSLRSLFPLRKNSLSDSEFVRVKSYDKAFAAVLDCGLV